jgi:hypothetical protein
METDEKNMTMGWVTIEKPKLIEKIKQNRAEHERIYKESVEGYNLILKNKLKEMLKQVEANKLIDPVVPQLYKPTNHLKEYDSTLSMLVYDIHDVVTLSSSEFSNYVLDDWAWKGSYLSTSFANISGSAQYK